MATAQEVIASAVDSVESMTQESLGRQVVFNSLANLVNALTKNNAPVEIDGVCRLLTDMKQVSELLTGRIVFELLKVKVQENQTYRAMLGLDGGDDVPGKK